VALASSTLVDQFVALRQKRVTSRRLTEVYLERLHRFDPALRCVVTYCDEAALEQADRADRELASGTDRGMLHGIPWGAKDLIAIPPFKTTWGARPYREQVRPEVATVAKRLEKAGAVLLAKLSLGTLAWGDIWYEATTKNPWNLEQGSSGSSAGSCAAVAGGLCTFALGSETLGSIVSPSRRCRVTGLRPSFGRVSRHGCMPLAWSMDKIGPIARRAEDCGIVLSYIQGPDGKDASLVQRDLRWPSPSEWRQRKVGIIEGQLSTSENIVVDWLQAQGIPVVKIQFPDTIPLRSLQVGLSVESAAMFDGLLRQGVPDEDLGLWGPSFREAQFAGGIHYVQSMRARSRLIRETEKTLRSVDVLLGGEDLLRTNLTGHPSIVVTFGQDQAGPRTAKLTARYFSDAMLSAMADALQRSLPPGPALPEHFLT
jgi:Asp-tRNA(Asn)/Glu-tRNA(Gln) amidotransferase A subunit family amidase